MNDENKQPDDYAWLGYLIPLLIILVLEFLIQNIK